MALEQMLSHRKVVIVGEPGSGKSTFLRRVAFELCRTLRGTRPADALPFLAPADRRFPILVRVAEFAKLLQNDRSPKLYDSPEWLPYFLGKQSDQYRWITGESFFQRKLEREHCLVMVDGLDEAPDVRLQKRIARLFERTAQVFPNCDFIVSTRPKASLGDSVLADFYSVRIIALEEAEILAFLDRFARALALTDGEAKKFKGELERAIGSQSEIRGMASNAVMLTALAVLQHNDQRLPEYRVDLYQSILGWLAAAREDKEGRLTANECLKYMRRLALYMQDAPGKQRLVQVNRRTAAELLAGIFGGTADAQEELLEREALDSGIISSTGKDVKFWHLSFQEYLAALEIGGLPEKLQIETLVAQRKLFRKDWNETLNLLGGVLLKQGEAKVDGFFEGIVRQLGDNPTLRDDVGFGSLLQGMLWNLSAMGYKPNVPKYDRMIQAGSRVQQLLEGMNKIYREALVLRDITELTYEDVAEILGVSVGTAKLRVQRGREALRKGLDAGEKTDEAAAIDRRKLSL
jgi:predicted NACHT family NTPase/predicted DNA-binding protein (UPF0251 family)